MPETSNICVIPARMASRRFAGKPVAPLLGFPLVLHVVERCRLCDRVDRIIVATCDEEIRKAVEDHGADVVMTSDAHPGCVDRTEEAVDIVAGDLKEDDFVLLIQGDEALVRPEMMVDIIDAYEKSKAPAVVLASRLYRTEDYDDPDVVKVVTDPAGRALYFSRSPVPFHAHADNVPMYQHTGVLGFSVGFLRQFGKLERTPLEIIEHVDLMRVIEHGFPVQVVFTERETIGVDNPADLIRAEGMLEADDLTATYLPAPSQR